MEVVKSFLEAGKFDMEMEFSLGEYIKSTDKENIEEKETVKNEMEAVKSLLEAGEFDMEMDIERSKSEQTPPRNSSETRRSVKIEKKKQLQNRLLKYKKKLEFSCITVLFTDKPSKTNVRLHSNQVTWGRG